MCKLKLLWSYEDHKSRKPSKDVEGITQRTGRALELQMKSITDKLTDEESKELDVLMEESKVNERNITFTNKVHKITDLYNELKYVFDEVDRDNIVSRIGMLQLEIERLREKDM